MDFQYESSHRSAFQNSLFLSLSLSLSVCVWVYLCGSLLPVFVDPFLSEEGKGQIAASGRKSERRKKNRARQRGHAKATGAKGCCCVSPLRQFLQNSSSSRRFRTRPRQWIQNAALLCCRLRNVTALRGAHMRVLHMSNTHNLASRRGILLIEIATSMQTGEYLSWGILSSEPILNN